MKLLKALLLLVAVAGAFFSFVLWSQYQYVPYVSSYIEDFRSRFNWPDTAIAYFLLAMLILFAAAFLIVLFLPARRKKLIIEKKQGDIDIPKKTIEAVVANACKPLINPEQVKIKTTIGRKEKVNVSLTAHVADRTQFQSLATELQQRIEAALEHSLEIKTSKVTVHIKEKEPQMDHSRKLLSSKSTTRVV